MEFSFFTYHDRKYASLSILGTDSFIYLLGIVEINLNFFELSDSWMLFTASDIGK